MEIFLGIVAVILFLIITLLLIPVHINIKKDDESGFDFEIKLLFFKLGMDSDSESPTTANIKKVFDLDKKKDDSEKKPNESFLTKITRYSALISDVFKEATSLIRKITVERLRINVICAEENAADTAISYGKCCAIILPIVGTINSLTKVKKDSEKIDISCDYTSEKGSIGFDIMFYVRVYSLLSALLKIGARQVKRNVNSGEKK